MPQKMPQPTPAPVNQVKPRFRVKTPGKIESKPTPAVKTPERKPVKAELAAAGRDRKPKPGRRVVKLKPGAGTPGKPVKEVRAKDTAPGVKAMRVPARMAKKPPAKPITITGLDRRILMALEKGPTTFQVLTKRTGMSQNKLLKDAKKLEDAGYIKTKMFKGVKKYKLSEKGKEFLHPVRFPFTLFKRKRRGRRRRRIWGKGLTRKQRLRRLDMAIGAFIVALVILVSFQSYLVFQDQPSEPDNNNTNTPADTMEPVIVWMDQPEIFDDPFGTLLVRLLVFDPGESPSGINANKVRVQYGFASSLDLSEPNISNWTYLAPTVNLPYVNVTLRRNWAPLNGYFIFIRCYAFDNSDNVAINTFKVLIYL
jgi:DNA-binding transcriptional ArsR family regulator